MSQLKIGIVEDELLIAESIAVALSELGYQPTQPARSYEDALKMIEQESPELLLVDISISGDLDGIDLASKVNEQFGIPFIFLTSYSDEATVNRAKAVNPYAYLVKPFNESDLFSAIEIAFNNYNEQKKKATQESSGSTKLKDAIFIKQAGIFHKIKVDDILYVKSDNVYLNIHTQEKNYVVRTTLTNFLLDFAGNNFVRVHRSYAVNTKYLESIRNLSVMVAGQEVPLNKSYRQELLTQIKSWS